MSRVAFLFTSSRDESIAKAQRGQEADTALRGFNYIPGAQHFTVAPKSMRSIVFISRLLHYDFVVAQDNLLLGYVVSLCARAFRFKTQWFYVAINSSTLMRRFANHRIRLFLLKKFWASYARIICLSFEQLEDFVRLGITRDHLTFVPFGVDVRFFQSAKAVPEEALVVSVGRDMGRDYATLFAAAQRSEYRFTVVAAPKNILPELKVPANVSVLYNRSLLEIRDLYTRARLVVVASKSDDIPDGSDCSGQTVILDALAAGKAVIATRRSWISDYFVPGQDLIVVEPNDPDALAQAIDSLWHDSAKRARIAASGHDKVAAHYTTKTFADALCAIMDSTTPL
jgi:glycosyltransferase involved in cell wall biosynthesis